MFEFSKSNIQTGLHYVLLLYVYQALIGQNIKRYWEYVDTMVVLKLDFLGDDQD